MKNRTIGWIAFCCVAATGCGGSIDGGEEPLVIITTGDSAGGNDGGTSNDLPGTTGNNDVSVNNASTNNDTSSNNASTNNDTSTNNTTSNNDNNTSTNNSSNNTTEEPCGNGVIEDGETCDGDCPTSCDDRNGCTMDSMTGSADACTAVCENVFDTACNAYSGSYGGDYFIKAEEKVGSTVVNSVTCSGTFQASVDAAASGDTLTGSAECDYPGSLGGFEGTQTATITGNIAADGTFTARIVHDFGTQRDGSFSIEGTVDGSDLVVDDTGSFRPHPMSAVPWEVVIKLD